MGQHGLFKKRIVIAVKVAGEQYYNIDGQLAEIKRQLRQPNGYPFDPTELQKFLQRGVEGKFVDVSSLPPPRRRKPKPKWKVEADGSITFTVKSGGTTGAAWITKLEAAGHKVSDYAKQILSSPDFVPTKGIMTKIVVLPGKFWADKDRLTKNIRQEAARRLLVAPNAEVGCLMRMMFTNEDIKEMELSWLVAMHEPIKDSGGSPGQLGAGDGGGGSWLSAYWANPDFRWDERRGFAFAVSQVSA